MLSWNEMDAGRNDSPSCQDLSMGSDSPSKVSDTGSNRKRKPKSNKKPKRSLLGKRKRATDSSPEISVFEENSDRRPPTRATLSKRTSKAERSVFNPSGFLQRQKQLDLAIENGAVSS